MSAIRLPNKSGNIFDIDNGVITTADAISHDFLRPEVSFPFDYRKASWTISVFGSDKLSISPFASNTFAMATFAGGKPQRITLPATNRRKLFQPGEIAFFLCAADEPQPAACNLTVDLPFLLLFPIGFFIQAAAYGPFDGFYARSLPSGGAQEITPVSVFWFEEVGRFLDVTIL